MGMEHSKIERRFCVMHMCVCFIQEDKDTAQLANMYDRLSSLSAENSRLNGEIKELREARAEVLSSSYVEAVECVCD